MNWGISCWITQMGDGYIISGVRKHKVSNNNYNNISNYANHKRVGILTITIIILANTLIPTGTWYMH